MFPYSIRLMTLIAATATAMALGGCAGDTTPRASAQYDDDVSINAKVEAAVMSVPGIHAHNVRISTEGAVVTLTGTADNTLAARNAVQAARQVSGVKKVNYDIKVP